MKHPGQMMELLDEGTHYKKIETNDYIVTYADFPTFIFIDYLLVTSQHRGKGTGSKILNKLKERNKTIVLEVEPPDAEDHSTMKRIRFYEKNGFVRAEHIQYTRFDEDGETYTMDIYYWSPDTISEREVMSQMATICRKVHNFKAEKYYGRIIADPETVLTWQIES